jgi:Rod binding domain-containing protein
VEKLARLSSTPVDAAASFDALFASLESGEAAEVAEDFADPMRADLRSRLAPALEGASAAKPYREFEAFVLQTFIQQMLPKDAEHVFGEGLAGSFWGSMLAEQIAGQLAKAGGIGIAELMAAQRGSTPPSALPGYVSSLELSFADSVRPSAGEADDSLLTSDES